MTLKDESHHACITHCLPQVVFLSQGELFLLVTDQGYLHESRVIWETLSNVEGDGHLVSAEFRTLAAAPPVTPSQVKIGSQEQVDQE